MSEWDKLERTYWELDNKFHAKDNHLHLKMFVCARKNAKKLEELQVENKKLKQEYENLLNASYASSSVQLEVNVTMKQKLEAIRKIVIPSATMRYGTFEEAYNRLLKKRKEILEVLGE